MQKTAKEKLAEKNIKWVEAYTDKTQFLKDQFDATVGEGSYFRFEGVNIDTGDEYYCILSPANVHKPRAKFFAGVRKLPATYSAGGQYFDSMDRAAEYARETWGITIPDNLKPYTSAKLFGISKKIDDWKKHKEELEDTKDEEKNKKESSKRRENMMVYNSLYNFFQKEAMGATHMHGIDESGRDPSKLFDFELVKQYLSLDPDVRSDESRYEELFGNHAPVMKEWNKIFLDNPYFVTAYREAKHRIFKNLQYLYYTYGIPKTEGQKFMKTYVAYNPMHGFHVAYASPYISTGERYGKDRVVTPQINKFTMSYRHFDSANEENILSSLAGQINSYASQFGVNFEPEDFGLEIKSHLEEIDESAGKQKKDSMVCQNLDPNSKEGRNLYNEKPLLGVGSSFFVNKNGLKKIVESFAQKSPAWKQVLDGILSEEATNNKTSINNINKLMEIDGEFLKKIYEKLKYKYDQIPEAQASMMGLVPPPKWKLDRKTTGQQSGAKFFGPKNQYSETKFDLEIINLLKAGIEQEANEENVPVSKKIKETMDKDKVRRRFKFQVPLEEVERSLSNVKDSAIVRNEDGTTSTKSYEELYNEYHNKKEDMRKAIEFLRPKPGQPPNFEILTGNSANYIGYDTLEDSIKSVIEHFSGQQYDPATKKLLGVAHGELGGAEIDNPEHFTKVNVNDLIKFKTKMEESGGKPPAPEATATDLGIDLGTETSVTEETPAVETTETAEAIEPIEEQVIPATESQPIQTVPSEEVDEVDFEGIDFDAPSLEEKLEQNLDKKISPEIQEAIQPPAPPAPQVTKPKPTKKKVENTEFNWDDLTEASGSKNTRNVLSKTILNLIRISEDLDNEGKTNSSEEIHKIIRKYIKSV